MKDRLLIWMAIIALVIISMGEPVIVGTLYFMYLNYIPISMGAILYTAPIVIVLQFLFVLYIIYPATKYVSRTYWLINLFGFIRFKK